jgi:hypothetical protein
MSTNIKNPKDQDDHEKGMLSNQPPLTGVTPTALLGSREQKLIKGMTPLGTDYEMHISGKANGEEHPRPVKAVTHLFGE